MNRRYYVLGVFLVAIGLLAVATFASSVQAMPVAQDATATPAAEEEATAEPAEEPTAAPTEEAAPAEEAPAETEAAEDASMSEHVIETPFLNVWLNSPHADTSAEAFNHWNEDDPPVVPESCARCHSTPGYQDYLGADGSEAGVVNQSHPTGTTVECVACHNDAASQLTSVTFPSGIEITDLGKSARCMVCHQGRASGLDVTTAVEEAGLAEHPDAKSEDLGFINIHYYAAAASLYGSETHGGFQYPDLPYQPKFNHAGGIDSCTDCHQPHSLEVKVEVCATCHDGVASVEDLHDVRMQGSLRDYDGDGNIEEGIYYELDGLRTNLMTAMQAYASSVNEAPIAYNSASYPYFFVDTNEDGEASDDEAVRDNAYKAWTPRLLEAAYNYQTSLKDPGAFAHNAKYHIELLHDSIQSLNEAMANPAVDMSMAARDDAGHFNPNVEAFMHFQEEEDGNTPADCAKCHNADGLPFFLENGVNIKQKVTDSLACTTCHSDLQEFTLRESPEVQFPSGATLSFDDPKSNLCLNCHQGRESTFSVNAAIIRAKVGDDDVSDALRFLNPHYFAAGATVFGGEASGAYQYDGKEYVGRNEHRKSFDTCVECHTAHELKVQVQECAECHDTEDVTQIRDEDDVTDWDGDGDVTEGLAGEIATVHEMLGAAIQTYGADVAGAPIVYAPHNYPYWYVDVNKNGEFDADELNSDNRYANWTPTLLRAAYNYQYVAKDPGAFAHNGKYILQVLYDSLEAIGGSEAVANLTRP